MRRATITKKDVLYLTISLFIVVAAWVGFNIYHSFVTSTIDEVLQMQITPISGQFDTQTIQQLKGRQKVTPQLELSNPVPSASLSAGQPDAAPTPSIPETTGSQPRPTPTSTL